MLIVQATAIAERVKAELAPYCERIEIAGSVRRRKSEVKDIEIVAIPQRVIADLFGSETTVDPHFCAVVNQWRAVKGLPTGKYTQRRLPDGINLDLFRANADNWGLQYAIRTGSADYSHYVLATGWVKAGYTSVEGQLHRLGRHIPIREEADLFTLLGLPGVDPSQREWPSRS
jgi:DNA polymerase/3'-5' exonuclease PolX